MIKRYDFNPEILDEISKKKARDQMTTGNIMGGLRTNNLKLSNALMDKNLTLRYIAIKTHLFTEEVERVLEVKSSGQRLHELQKLCAKMKRFDEEIEMYRHKALSEFQLRDFREDREVYKDLER